jgi:hypothetical protein
VNKQEAKTILIAQLAEYRRRSYADLQDLLKSQDAFEITSGSGTRYQLEFLAVWDDKPGGNLRIFGHIDDRGIRAFRPLAECFIMAPDGSFVGEGGGAI